MRLALRSDNGRVTPERDPRLVLRFAVAVGVCLTLAAVAIILVIRYLNLVEAEKNAGRHARYVAHAILQNAVEDRDFGPSLDAGRRTTLDRMFRSQVLVDGTLLALLVRPDGSIAYATDPAAESGLAIDRERVSDALAGTVTSTDDDLRLASADGATATKVLVSYVAASTAGVAVIYQDYGPIADAANAAFLPIAGTLELVVVVLFLLLVPILSRVTKRLRLQLDQIRHQAEHDDLTGLPNRTRFRSLVTESLAEGPVAVLLLDLDGFREVNDALGHDVGDELLREIPTRLAPAIPPTATLARLGGDEFAVLLPRATGRDPRDVATTLRTLLDAPLAVRGLALAVGASTGIAISPDHGEDAETLLKNADVAMYDAKSGQAPWSVYDAARDPNDPEKIALAAELRGAFTSGEIILHYQPKLDLRSGRIVAAEALARWQHPTRGLLPPDEWIPLAERSGLHTELVRTTIRAVAAQLRAWEAEGHVLRASLNLTMPDLLDLALPGTIAETLGEQGLDASRLDLEITESVFMSNPDRVRRVLTILSEMGVGLSIDDYGTGYSSLAYLSSLPVDELKIDRSFVTGLCENVRDNEIVRSTIQLGHTLGLRVVAEGVETEDELRRLTELGCDLAQGFHVGRPVPAEALTAQMRELEAVAAALRAAGTPPAVAQVAVEPTTLDPTTVEPAAAEPATTGPTAASAASAAAPPADEVSATVPRPRPLKALEGLERIRLELEEIEAAREATAVGAR